MRYAEMDSLQWKVYVEEVLGKVKAVNKQAVIKLLIPHLMGIKAILQQGQKE